MNVNAGWLRSVTIREKSPQVVCHNLFQVKAFPPQMSFLLSLCNQHLFTVLLVRVSSRPDVLFNCTSGEHLPAGLVCDFKPDCEDGSDEEFCGTLTGKLFRTKCHQRTSERYLEFEICLCQKISVYVLIICVLGGSLLVKGHASLSVTPVVGKISALSPTAGVGRWRTSPQYLDWTIPTEVRLVNINLLPCFIGAITLLIITLKQIRSHLQAVQTLFFKIRFTRSSLWW